MSLFRKFGGSIAAEREEERAAEAARLADGEAGNHQPPVFDAIAVLNAADVTDDQQERVARALKLLATLPTGTPDAVRKKIVGASLTAFDISLKAITEAAAAEIEAFNTYVATGHKQLEDLGRQSQERIAHLQADIAKIQKRLDVATADQTALDEATTQARERVRPVFDFFAELSPRNVSKAPPGPQEGRLPQDA